MKILVVGGAGYIGSHCVKGLLDEGYQVVVVDNLYRGHIKAIDSRAQFYKGDILDAPFLRRVFSENKIEGVIHFAANSLVGESMEKPLLYFRNNVSGTESLLSVMHEFKVKYIVFSSSAAVYGEPKKIPISEDASLNPTNPYGQTKVMMEQMMKWCDQAYGMKYIALRYFNVAGADPSGVIGEDHRPETHLVPLVIDVALGRRDKLIIYGNDYPTKDGTCIRDYLHIEDLISAHLLALKRLLDGGESDVFNLGSEAGYSVKEIIDATSKVVGHPIAFEYGPRRAGDPSILVASRSKAMKELHWHPKHTQIEDCIKDAYNFHKTHENGLE